MNTEEAVKALKSVVCDNIKKKSSAQASIQTVKPTKKDLLDFLDEEDMKDPKDCSTHLLKVFF